MRFKEFLQEGIIVPKKLNIKSNDVDELNKQFKNEKIEFKWDTGPHGAYIPKLDKIIIYLVPDMEYDLIATLISHEVIHLTQDMKSGMRMGAVIQKEQDEIRNLAGYLDDLDDDEEVSDELLAKLEKMKKDIEIKMDHLNPEEEMAYAYMYAKMYQTQPFKKVLKGLSDEWVSWTNQKPSKRMLKYFGMYWMIRKDL